jgi:hypothetical protein
MGSPLPAEKYKKADGTSYLSGTEYELEDAFAAHPGPDVLLYRRGEEPKWGARDAKRREKEEQFALLEAYIASLKATTRFVEEYPRPAGFKERLRNDLRKILARRLQAPPRPGISQDAPPFSGTDSPLKRVKSVEGAPLAPDGSARSPAQVMLKELAVFREQGIIDEDVHKRFQIRVLENYLRIDGVSDVKS